MPSLISLPGTEPLSKRALMMIDLEDCLADLEKRIAEEKAALAPLVSGEVRLGEKLHGAARFTDITPRIISQRRKAISRCEMIVNKLRAAVKL
jgi:hypothetical protein